MAHPTTPTTSPWLFSSSHSHPLIILPQTSILLTPPPPPTTTTTHLHYSRVNILHAVRTRNNNVNFDPFKFGDDEDDDNEDGDDLMLMFPRRMRTRRRRRGGRSGRERWWWSNDVRDYGRVQGGILQQLVHELWIFKVFRSYGVFLPVILISLLLATGPKAFLMGSGVPFGLSLLAFAFNKLSERLDFSPNPDPKQRPKKSRFGRQGVVSMEDQDRQARETGQSKRRKRSSYQSRVNRFGGWDELITENETETPLSTKARFEMMTGKGVESSSEKTELPLLPRLLVGLLPFLGNLL